MIDEFFDRVYDKSNYNCAHFVCEVWKSLTGDDISSALTGAMRCERYRRLDPHALTRFVPLEAPHSPCLALFQCCRKDPHVGIYLDGRILHIVQRGVEWTVIDTLFMAFNQVRFYDVKNSDHC